MESNSFLGGTGEDPFGEDADNVKYLDLRHTQRLALSIPSIPVRQLHELARALCRTLGLSSSLAERAILLIDTALERRLINRGGAGRRAVGAAIYWLARGSRSNVGGDRPLPLTVREVASLLGVSQVELTPSLELIKGLVEEVYGIQIAPTMDPSLYVEKLASTLKVVRSKQVILKAMALCDLCQEKFSLVIGRKPEAIAMACLLIAENGESDGAQDLPAKRPMSWRRRVKRLCEQVGLASDTVILRCSEIRNALVNEARQLPFGVPESADLARDKVDGLLDDILRHHQLMKESLAGNKSDPPAYEESLAKRRLREDQVEKALKRLSIPPNVIHKTPTSLTFEDILIERLLLHRVPREHIEQTTSLHQLLTLEETCMVPEDNFADSEEILATDAGSQLDALKDEDVINL